MTGYALADEHKHRILVTERIGGRADDDSLVGQ